MNSSAEDPILTRLALVGSYAPRQCGIATFTADLRASLKRALGSSSEVVVVPVTDAGERYDYGEEVWFEIAERDRVAYEQAAEFLNINGFQALSVQHEFGIFGGQLGSHVLSLLRGVRMPVAATLHTVLREPDDTHRAVMRRLIDACDRLVVMTQMGRQFLEEVYGASPDRIDLIPHGIPDMAFVDPSFHKDRFRANGKHLLLTFGLLGPGKGIEYVIRAMPQIVKAHPQAVYMVVGATHPSLRRHEGEAYRMRLQRLAQELGVQRQVVFHDRFISSAELQEFLGAADVYIAPYPGMEQICSGTLAYALGAGKAVVATPFWHAQELLAEERGVLVQPNSDAIAHAVTHLLSHPELRDAMRKRAYLYSRSMTWPSVGREYIRCFERMLTDRRSRARTYVEPKPMESSRRLPPIQLTHLRRLTDDTGLLQHAVNCVPNYAEGYSLDDNARGLILMCRMERLGLTPDPTFTSRYAAFIQYAFNPANQRFRNFLTYDRQWTETHGSEDSHGRALWALGTTVSCATESQMREWASQLFEAALLPAAKFTSPRAWSFTLLGIHEYLKHFAGDRIAADVRQTLTARLMSLHTQSDSADWRWFEDRLTYCNARLPEALIVTGAAVHDTRMANLGLETLAWLNEFQLSERDCFLPVGSNGFASSDGTRARFDQQPIEALCTVDASMAAYVYSGDERWWLDAQRAFEWFLGRNDLGLPVFDVLTGACFDGLHPDRLNRNQGAESTLAYLLALAAMHAADSGVVAPDRQVSADAAALNAASLT